MTVFQFYGPLPLESPLYKGRVSDLQKLIRWCQGETQHYGILYGGRQSGKTSLLLRLDRELSLDVVVCWVDFEYISDGSPARAFEVLAQKIAEALETSLPGFPIHDAMSFSDYLCQVLSSSSVRKLVLLIEELGAVHKDSRFAIANGLRAIFNDRVRPSRRALGKLMVIVAGNIELFELANTEVSPFANICQKHYLPDLERQDVLSIINVGLGQLGVGGSLADTYGSQIYQRTRGYPYLTQYLGHSVEIEIEETGSPDHNALERGVSKILLGDDPLIKHFRRSLTEQRLESAARALILENIPFDRRDEGMARLELIGLAQNERNSWKVRNPLFRLVLDHWLNEQARHQEPLSTGLVRILDQYGVPVGAGFMIDQKRVVTCGHVVATALEISDEDRPEDDITFDFPLLAPGVRVWASIENWHPYVAGSSNDLITLQVKTNLPDTAFPLPLRDSGPTKDHPFRAFGFPSGRPDGVWATGVISSPITGGRIQIEDVKVPGYSVVQGFSGSPVWSDRQQGVVGMVVATDKDINTKTGFMIPSRLIHVYS